MSYCRFSSNDWQCDLYCYMTEGGFMVHIASTRTVFKEKLPAIVKLEMDANGLPTKDYTERLWHRHREVQRIKSESDSVPIGLPYDGQNFFADNIYDFKNTIKMLIDAGYRGTDTLLEAIEEELNRVEDNNE